MSQTKAQLIDPTDGSIVNADINASAAIAGSKISPDFTSNLTVSANSAIATISATNASNTSVSTLLYKNRDGNSNLRDIASIEGESTGNGGYGALAFHTAFNNSLAERMRIDQSGNVGINESASNMSNGKLTVKIDTNKHIGFSGTQGEVNNVPALVAYQDNGSLKEMGFRGVDLRFATGSAERVRIDDAGNIREYDRNKKLMKFLTMSSKVSNMKSVIRDLE